MTRKNEMIKPANPKMTGCRKRRASNSRFESSSLSNIEPVSNQTFIFFPSCFILSGAKKRTAPNARPKKQEIFPIHETESKIISLVAGYLWDIENIFAKLETSNLKKKKISENREPAIKKAEKSMLWL